MSSFFTFILLLLADSFKKTNSIIGIKLPGVGGGAGGAGGGVPTLISPRSSDRLMPERADSVPTINVSSPVSSILTSSSSSLPMISPPRVTRDHRSESDANPLKGSTISKDVQVWFVLISVFFFFLLLLSVLLSCCLVLLSCSAVFLHVV